MTPTLARARVVALVAAAVLVAAAAVALAVGPSGSAGRATTAAGSAVSADGSDVSSADQDAIRSELAGHGTAMLRRDRAGYAAGVDTSGAASQFRAVELAAFDHAADVPFASYAVSFDRLAPDPVAVPAAASRLSGRVAIVRADVTYALSGVDSDPATHPVYLTMVERADGWKIANDTDLADTGGTSWRGPWYFGPLVVVRAGHGLVLGHPADESTATVAATQQQLRALAGDLDQAVGVVDGVWGGDWPQRVAIEVVGSAAELNTLANDQLAFGGVTALAVAEPVASVSSGPDAGAGQRILVNGRSLASVSAIGRAVLLGHELTHVATRSVTSPTTPTWVVEGFADYVGNSPGAQPVRTVAAELAAGIAANGVPTALPADTAFVPGSEPVSGTGATGGATSGATGAATSGPTGGATGGATSGPTGGATTTGATSGATSGATGGTTPAQAYEQAWFAMRTIAQLAGPAAPAAFYRAVAAATTQGSDPAAAVDAALRSITALDTAAFTTRWQDLMRNELG